MGPGSQLMAVWIRCLPRMEYGSWHITKSIEEGPNSPAGAQPLQRHNQHPPHRQPNCLCPRDRRHVWAHHANEPRETAELANPEGLS